LAGNQPKNKIMQQYESKYNEMQQQLDTQKQNYLNQLETMRTNMQNSLQQLANPDSAKALIIGTTATYLQNVYNRISPYLDKKSYQQLTQQLQDIYSKDQQFATSYNQLFQNYLGMNVNLIDMLKQVQQNVFQTEQNMIDAALDKAFPNISNLGKILPYIGPTNNAQMGPTNDTQKGPTNDEIIKAFGLGPIQFFD
jgi:hypothetical protein